MLVLTRKPGEEVVIDGKIRVVVVSIKEGRVRLGFQAPENITVDRLEVHEKWKQEQQDADDMGVGKW